MVDCSLMKYFLKLLNKHIRRFLFAIYNKHFSDILFNFSKRNNFFDDL